jgi:type IV secretory pathway VirJ component
MSDKLMGREPVIRKILSGHHIYVFQKKIPKCLTISKILPYIELNLKKHNRQKIILAGYSFGSEVVTFLYNYMSNEWKNKVEFIVLISPSDNSDFKIHFLD